MDQLFKRKQDEILKKSLVFEIAQNQHPDTTRPPLAEIRRLFGKPDECFSFSIGSHPDFCDLRDDEFQYHYIVSMFIDISGSTRLGLKFDLPEVRFYKNAILKSAIEIFQAFDGHIHRLQGDAVFAFFGHKGMKKADAIINALNAASLMQAFNKTTLTNFFEENGLEPLKIRIGIDFGDNESVLWSKYGIGDTTEITTTSIHTDLAAKLQSRANGNNIMIGENVYTYLDLPESFLDVKTYQENYQVVEDKYIIKSPAYSMRLFNWNKYLNQFSFLPKEGADVITSPDHFEIKCYVLFDGNEIEYRSNSFALEKGLRLKYVLETKFVKPSYIKWRVENTGEEATKEGALSFTMDSYNDRLECYQTTKYNGHHNMVCSLFHRDNTLMAKDKFGIYVSDNKQAIKKLTPSSQIQLMRG
ncbi:class 3 adenylate cyclase [Paenibacillus phyllosphaerae]|uniref:Class 3 adenylate cyclase n=1 Tax=Paenibacillus phyllosphaerae TaxID=274593 RepID=A0A7W5B148_9BACL|nr:adenylate/guanylate cyclase domain-containing protein [Paenibacillus phyllosphaerae]MBB3111786.1 class 3 adenylate cyclase [Paenibacillus phyllosphaerae]